MPRKSKTITVYVHQTCPLGRPGDVLEVSPDDPNVRHQLSTGVLSKMKILK